MNFIKKIIEGKKIFVIEVGAYKIKTACCQYKNGEINILGYSEKRQEQTDIISGEIASIQGVSETINLALNKIVKKNNINAKDVFINIPSNLIFTHGLNLEYIRENKNSQININELDKIIGKIENEAIIEAKNKINNYTGYNDVDTKLITSSITNLNIDGLKVINPIGFIGEKIEIGLLNIFTPLSRYNIINSIGKNIGKNINSIIPIEISLPKLFEKTKYAYKDILFINVGFDRTSFILQKKGVITHINKFDLGISELIKYIKSKHSQITTIEIINKLNDDNFYKTEKNNFLEIWQDGLFLTLNDIIKDKIIPNNICFFSDEKLNFLNNFLNKENFLKNKFHILKDINFIQDELNLDNLIKGDKSIIKQNNISLISMIIAGNEIISQKTNIIVKIINNFLKKNV